MREINKIFVHCSATKPSQNISVDTIRQWHKAKGWSDIGYHYYISRDGKLHEGRPIHKTGAHVKGSNTGSIGVCVEGGVDEQGKADANFTFQQYDKLYKLIHNLIYEYELSTSDVLGHREKTNKACPSFDIHGFLQNIDTKAVYRPMTVKFGDSGVEVMNIQKALKDAGYDLDVDSDYGPMTRAQVREFQADNDLSITGIVGEKTYKKLLT